MPSGPGRAPVTSIVSGTGVVHCRSFSDETRTLCARWKARTAIANNSREITCKRCIRLIDEMAQRDSKHRLEMRNKLEARAKACFEIFARTAPQDGFIGNVWEREDERTRQAFREILDYTETLFLEDDDARRERAWRERQG